MSSNYYRNTNSHGASIGSKRYRSGSVFVADGADAQKWEGVPGVEKASKSDYDEYQSTQRGGQLSSEKSGEMQMLEKNTQARVDARRVTVSAPLQRVVGDDQAPLGPPTGTLSTKAEEAEKDLAHALAFGPNEAKQKVEEPEEKLTPHAAPKHQLVHNQQVEDREAANEAAGELNAMAREAGSTDDDTPAPKDNTPDES